MGILFFFEGYKNPQGFFEKNLENVTWKRALILAFALGLVSSIVGFFAMNISGNFLSSLFPSLSQYYSKDYTFIYSLLILIIGPFAYPLGLFIYSGIFYLIGAVLGGKGEFKNFYLLFVLILLMLLPFQLIVSLIFFFASLIFPSAGTAIYVLMALFGIPILLYGAYLLTQALKLCLGLSTKRAILVWAIPGGLWVLMMLLSLFSLFLLQSNPLFSGQFESPCSNSEYSTVAGIGFVFIEENFANKIHLHYKSQDKLEDEIQLKGNSALQGISDLSCLEYLDLDEANISDISALSELTNLEILDLSRTKVTNLSALNKLVNLEELYLYGSLVSDISGVQNLTKLKKLALSQTPVSDISALQNLKNLKELNLAYTKIKDLSSINSLTSLTELNLYGVNVPDISPLKNLTNLKELDLSKTTITNISPLSGLNITHLRMSQTKVSDFSPLKELKSLILLDLSKTTITPSQLTTLKQLKNLRLLHLEESSILNSQCPELKQALPNTTIYKGYNNDKC